MLIELEAIAIDLQDIVSTERENKAKFNALKEEMDKKREKEPGRASVGSPANPNLFLPEIDYISARLRAVKEYIASFSGQGYALRPDRNL